MDLKFTTIAIEAFLGGQFIDITNDVMQDFGISVSYGIRGNKPTDILADVGQCRFTLKNNDYKYFPGGASPLTGWGKGTLIRVRMSYTRGLVTKFYGYVSDLDFTIGDTANEYFCKVTCLDWMSYASRNPILSPDIETNKRADEAITTILAAIPQKTTRQTLDTGVSTFPAVFDSTSRETTAYAEFAKLVNSEYGRLYLRADGGIVFEASDYRDGSVPTSGVYDNNSFLILSDAPAGAAYILQSSNYLTDNPSKIMLNQKNAVVVSSGIDNIDIDYGKNLVNYATVTAFPKRIDIDRQIVYQLDSPLEIAPSQTIRFRATYKEQSSGAKANAIPSSMLTPEVPGATDPYLKTLLHFTGNFTDSTGLRTWTNNDVGTASDVYIDGFGIQRISEAVLGQYAVFGGYANYYITTPNSADFDFGSGAFTIGWFENRLDTAVNAATFSRDKDSNVPAYLVGKSVGGNLTVSMSSNGTTFDIASDKSLGKINLSRWVYYEISRDSSGWFYTFADGRLIDKWYSPLALYSGGGVFGIGLTQNTNYYCYMGLDEFFVRKGQCLHTEDFEPPRIEIPTTLPGDYLMNTAANGTGTNISSSLAITATYDSVGVDYVLTNNNASTGYVWYLTARGRGVYAYNPIDEITKDATSIAAHGYQSLSLRQQYQQNTAAGTAIVTDIVTNQKDPATGIRSITFYANRSYANMMMFLYLDVGDLIQVTHAPSGFDADYFYIQSVSYEISAGGIVRYTFGLIRDYEH